MINSISMSDKKYKSNKVLKRSIIREEINDLMQEFHLIKIDKKNDEWVCFYEKDGENSFHSSNYLIFTLSHNGIGLLKCKDTKIEEIKIDNRLRQTNQILEKRENGLVYSIIKKKYSFPFPIKQDVSMTDLSEKRYVFTKNKIESILESLDFNQDNLIQYFFRLSQLKEELCLDSLCDYCSEFSTHLRYHSLFDKRNYTSIHTYLNGKDISSLYQKIREPYSLNRIYNLYYGIINSKNKIDACSIELGFLPRISYCFKDISGITKKEDSLIGISPVWDNDEKKKQKK